MSGSTIVLAHAFGKRYDLPIPLVLFVVGGALVVVLSFLLVMRREVRGDEQPVVEGTEALPMGPTHPALGALAVLVTAVLVVVGIVGSQVVSENIVPTLFWLVVWIGVPVSCGLVGDWTRPLNPFAALVRLVDRPRVRAVVLAREQPLAWPSWAGWWPAVALFVLLVCGELIVNLFATQPAVIGIGLLVYAVANLVAGLIYGRAWLLRGEVFSVLFATWGRLGWWRWGAAGRTGFAGGLTVPFERRVSRIAFVLLLLLSVNFDGLLATPQWMRLERDLPGGIGHHPHQLQLFRLGSLLALILVLTAAFSAFAWASARAGRHGTGLLQSLTGLVPSLTPIAFGYLVAHNAQYFFGNIQLLFPLIGNPVGRPSWPIHLPYPFNDTYEPAYTALPTAFYWYLGVVAIVVAHVVAVILAHRHLAQRGADERGARASEYPWLVAMVCYTVFSLILIAQPLVTGSA
ncbi:MAG: hypothetical protein M3N21_04790 [Actinomycetota bacterium]|nr:hypothetical protein [Actinomycetota bacterium]